MGDVFDNVIVRCVPLPVCVKGVTIPSDDDFYNIYINCTYSYEMQREILRHELKHVRNSDFHNFDDINIIEDRAEGY